MHSQQDVIIVTGSSGLIGSVVAKQAAAHFEVIGFDREGPPHPPPVAECVCVDLTSEDSVQRAFESVRTRHGEHLASVIHLAAYMAVVLFWRDFDAVQAVLPRESRACVVSGRL